jgi:hypothetical protein
LASARWRWRRPWPPFKFASARWCRRRPWPRQYSSVSRRCPEKQMQRAPPHHTPPNPALRRYPAGGSRFPIPSHHTPVHPALTPPPHRPTPLHRTPPPRRWMLLGLSTSTHNNNTQTNNNNNQHNKNNTRRSADNLVFPLASSHWCCPVLRACGVRRSRAP